LKPIKQKPESNIHFVALLDLTSTFKG